uniref:Uncharacterized protein n=1 Tax=Lactuca sativa TaxID=4236 RepID=A0A9R1WQM4_LACSA|nr:hypothetical protein LSAT_V11C900468000 [Lactuca sativa]
MTRIGYENKRSKIPSLSKVLHVKNFIGQVVSIEPMRVIKENASETRLVSIVAQDLSYISEHQNENAHVIILIRQPQVDNCLFGLRLHINDDMHHISEFKKAIVDIDLNVESSINTTQLNTKLLWPRHKITTSVFK